MAMKTKRIVSSVVSGTLLVLLALSTISAAERIALKGGADMRGAQGEAVISDTDSGEKEVVITARGLKPNEVYTVWLVNMKPKMDMRSPATQAETAATRPPFRKERSTSGRSSKSLTIPTATPGT
jgi:hypothetical protein